MSKGTYIDMQMPRVVCQNVTDPHMFTFYNCDEEDPKNIIHSILSEQDENDILETCISLSDDQNFKNTVQEMNTEKRLQLLLDNGFEF